MIYNFDTDDNNYAVAALLVYATFRSRDKSKFKITLGMWGQIQRFVKASMFCGTQKRLNTSE